MFLKAHLNTSALSDRHQIVTAAPTAFTSSKSQLLTEKNQVKEPVDALFAGLHVA